MREESLTSILRRRWTAKEWSEFFPVGAGLIAGGVATSWTRDPFVAMMTLLGLGLVVATWAMAERARRREAA